MANRTGTGVTGPRTMKMMKWVGVAIVASVMVLGLMLTPGLVTSSHSSPSSAVAAKCAGTVQCATNEGLKTAGPTYNQLVAPYAVFTGDYAYNSSGAAMRDQGYGSITLTWPGTIVAAYMVWSIMNDTVPAATATLNGVGITGTWVSYAYPSPCWAPTYIYTFVAPVTKDVINGVNHLTNFPSGITTGADPWASAQVDPMLEGASLVVVYTDPSVFNEVTLYVGAYTEYDGGSITATLPYTITTGDEANTTYIVSDGQLYGNSASWNGVVIDSNAFPGSDPKATSTTWSYGNLYDTKSYTVPVTVGSTSATATIDGGGDDCLTWTAQVVSVAVAPTEGPYDAVFSEAGLPLGSMWDVTIGATTMTGTVTSSGSEITFLLSDGTYSYSISSPSGWATSFPSGSFVIDGGPFFLEVPFHQAVVVNTLDHPEPVWNSGNLCTSLSTSEGSATCTSTISDSSTPLWFNFSSAEVTDTLTTVNVIASSDCIYLNFHSFDSAIVINLIGSEFACYSVTGQPTPGVNIVVNSEDDSFTLNQVGSGYSTNITTYGTTVQPAVLEDGSYLNTTVTFIGFSAETQVCPSGITDGRVFWSVTQIGTYNVFNTIFVDGTNVHVAPPNYAYSQEPMTPLDGTAFGYDNLYGNETTQVAPPGTCQYLLV